MTDEELLNMYKPMVKFIADICGPACEVVLHNVKDKDNSVIAIENGYHSGRGIGSPLTSLAKELIDQNMYQTHDYISNYNGASKGKDYLSSTYFIKNDDRLIGMMCINRDLSVCMELNNVISRLEKQYNLSQLQTAFKETLDVPVDEILHSLVAQTIEETGLVPSHMKISERKNTVRTLHEKGITKMKGAVTEIARQLDISEPTIYRYIKEVSE
ncbi:MAG: hypothetical protein EOM64_02145 [Erysipelotrichia bacterium]|nr:hypothetical protein [Erysipelotrichia bacterium]